MMEDDDRSDEQADAERRLACDSLLGTQLAPHNVSSSACTGPAPSAPRKSFFDEEYVAGRRVPSPPGEEAAPPRPIFPFLILTSPMNPLMMKPTATVDGSRIANDS
jgi:hypothetical protein